MQPMSKIQQISNKVRDCLNDSVIKKTKIYLSKDKGFWDQLWTCLDTIDDTEVAIQSFKDLKIQNFQAAPYILTYGLLQVLFVQQDAVENLKESLFDKQIIWEKEYPSLFLIRNIRNESIGHPTKNFRHKYCIIDRDSLSKEGFSYVSLSRSGFNKNNTRFLELFKNQEEALFKELTRLLEQIQKEEAEHKKKFDGESLAALLPSGEPYSLSLLRQLAYDQLAWIGFLEYKKKYAEIKKGIESRYGSLENTLRVPGTKLLTDELDRIFFRIEELKKSDGMVEIDFRIYADALVERLKELKTHLTEIDKEFATQ